MAHDRSRTNYPPDDFAMRNGEERLPFIAASEPDPHSQRAPVISWMQMLRKRRRVLALAGTIIALLVMLGRGPTRSTRKEITGLELATILETLPAPANPVQKGTVDLAEENGHMLRALWSCMAENNCGQNQTNVVLLSSAAFVESFSGLNDGEHIWAGSLISALREMNYTVVISEPLRDPSAGARALAQQYRRFPDLISLVLADAAVIARCVALPDCIKSTAHSRGVPLWKLHSLDFFAGATHPLGQAWTVNPESYEHDAWAADDFYLGYSIERACEALPVVPHEDRADRAFVLGVDQVGPDADDVPWPGLDFDDLPLETVAGTLGGHGVGHGWPAGIRSLGLLSRDEFFAELGRSKALVGLGEPRDSQLEYFALCLGVPFVNPVMGWDSGDPDDREKWGTQHRGLKGLGPPWVYHVRRGDVDGLKDALRRAAETPIGRYIKPEMTQEALKARLATLLNDDWRSRAETLLRERGAAGQGQFIL